MHLTESLLLLLRRSSRRQRFGASKLTTSRALPTSSGVGECSLNWKSRPAFCASTLLCSRLAVCSTAMRFAWDGPSSRHHGVLHGGNQGYGSGVLGSAVCVHRVFVAQSPTFGMNTRTDLGIFILEAIQISTWSAVMSKEGGQSEAEKKQPAKGVKTQQSEGWNSWKEDNEILTVFTWGVCSFKVNGINICLSCWFFLCTSLFCANLLLWLEIPGQTCVFPRNFPQMDKHACVSQDRHLQKGVPVFSRKCPQTERHATFPKKDPNRKACLCFPRQTQTERCACFPGNVPRQKGMPVFPKKNPNKKACLCSPRKTQTERRACVPQERARQKGVPVFPKKDPDGEVRLCFPRKTQTG